MVSDGNRLFVTDLKQDKLPASILVVDDDPILLEIAATNLQEEGYHVQTATNGQEAADLLEMCGFEMVVTDLEMPVMNGLELVRYIRSKKTLKYLPVLMVTGKEQAIAVDEAYDAGATSFLSKPLNWTLFSRSVRFVLHNSQTEAELRHARDLAQSASKLKQALLSNMSHEMRTPLNHIVGFGELLQSQVTGDNTDYADYIVSGGRRLLNVVNDMLFLSVAETDGVDMEEQELTIAAILSQVVEANSHAAKSKSIYIQVHNQAGDRLLRGDGQLLVMALSKFVDNAIKFSPQGSRIDLGFVIHGAANIPAFFVKDAGPGIPKDLLPALCNLFQQNEMGFDRSHEGMGVGLRIASLIVEAHGGRTSFVNEKNDDGLKVTIALPASRLSKDQSQRWA